MATSHSFTLLFKKVISKCNNMQRLSLGIPVKIEMIINSARWTMGRGERRERLFFSFPFPSSPARFFFPPLPSFPTKQRGLCGEESEVGLFFRRRFNRYLARVASFSLDYRQSFITLLIVAVSDKTELIFYLPLTLCCTEKRSSLNHVFLAREK